MLQEEVIKTCIEYEIVVPIELLNNSVEKVGLDAGCRISYKSITKQLTIKIKTVRSELLTKEVYSDNATFANTKRKRTVFFTM